MCKKQLDKVTSDCEPWICNKDQDQKKKRKKKEKKEFSNTNKKSVFLADFEFLTEKYMI